MQIKGPDEYLGADPLTRAVFFASADVVQQLPKLTRLSGGFCQLHDLRLVHDGVEAWIDHLLLHRYGFILIESRTLCVPTLHDKQTRWFQLLGETSREVFSPVKRVRACAEVVTALLRGWRETYTWGLDGIPDAEVGVYVSVAEAGELISEGLGFSSVIVNARQLTGLLNERHEQRYLAEVTQRRSGLALSPLGLSTDEVRLVGQYFLSKHEPLGRGAKYSQSELARYYHAAA